MKVLTRRNAALKNTAVTSRAIRASVINRRNSEKTEKRTVVTKAIKETTKSSKKENEDTISNTTTEKTKENVKPGNTGKKRGRPFKNAPTKDVTLPKPKTQINGTSNHTANKTQTKETRSSKVEKSSECDTGKSVQKSSVSKTRSNNTKKNGNESTPASPTSSRSPTVSSASEEKSIEKNNNETNGVLTKGPFSGSQSLSETSKKSDRKYQCGICMKVFLGSNDLRKHLRIHR